MIIPSVIILQIVITSCTSKYITWHADAQGSAVGITTRYWLDGPGTKPDGDDILRTVPEFRPASCTTGTEYFGA